MGRGDCYRVVTSHRISFSFFSSAVLVVLFFFTSFSTLETSFALFSLSSLVGESCYIPIAIYIPTYFVRSLARKSMQMSVYSNYGVPAPYVLDRFAILVSSAANASYSVDLCRRSLSASATAKRVEYSERSMTSCAAFCRTEHQYE